jgi:hypothetical protein
MRQMHCATGTRVASVSPHYHSRHTCLELRNSTMTTVALHPRIDDRAPTDEATRAPFDVDRATTGIGWFSIALGVAEIVAPCELSRLVGAEPNSERCRMDVWESRARLAPVLTEASSWMLLGNYFNILTIHKTINTGPTVKKTNGFHCHPGALLNKQAIPNAVTTPPTITITDAT